MEDQPRMEQASQDMMPTRRSSLEWELSRNQAAGVSSPIPIKRPNLPTPNLVLLTVDGYTVSHSLLVDNLPTDQYGFILDERYGITPSTYRSFERQYSGKCERQAQRWAELVPLARGNLVVFPAMSEKVKKALRKGLPKELRSNAWYHYSGAQTRQEIEPKKYTELVKAAMDNGNSALFAQIESDVSHTFANNRYFKNLRITTPFSSILSTIDEPQSQASLKRILSAIAHMFPNVGYTNGLNAIAGAFLLVTQDEQRSFWILASTIGKLLPDNYYVDMNLGCNVDQDVLASLIAWKLPAVHKKLQELEMSLHIVTSSWFTHLFVEQLPFETLLRVLDCFLSEGSKVLFRIALALFKMNQNGILAINDPFELAAFIRNMPRRQLDIITLMDIAFNGVGGLSSSWLVEERDKVTPFWRAKHAVRRFSRVSPAYCQAPIRGDQPRSACFAPVVVASPTPTKSSPTPSIKLALEDTMPIFERPTEIESGSLSSVITSSSYTRSAFT